jgi:multidrug efflux pump
MILSTLSIRRPIICLVASTVIMLVGLLAFRNLPVREYPSTDTPIVSVSTFYRGASPEVVEARVTRPLEDQISTIDGIRVLRATSGEQNSNINIEFQLNRNIDQAASDVRDRVARARSALPQDVNEPIIAKAEADSNPFMWLSFYSDRFSLLEITEIVDTIAVPRIQSVPGVGAVQLRGKQFAMRLWLDPDRLAAYQLTPSDVERALRQQNVEIPSGRIESQTREFPVRLQGDLQAVSEFENLVLATRGDYQVKFSDVGRAVLDSEEFRVESFFNGIPSVSVGVVRQSQSNLIEVANGVKNLIPVIQSELPEGLNARVGFDGSIFVERSVREVYRTLFLAAILVIVTIFFFLRDARATLIPLFAIPVSVIGSFAVMSALGFSINILTLLALVLAVGLVVDDAIVMLENIYRRIEEGESPIHAALFGSRQVAFAVIATTLTLAAVFLPVAFQTGSTGRLFYEFGLTLCIAVLVSSFVALTLTPMLCSRLLKGNAESGKVGGYAQHSAIYRLTEPFFVKLNTVYASTLKLAFRFWPVALLGALIFSLIGPWLYTRLDRELVPVEDRGLFLNLFIGPQGSTPEYTRVYAKRMAEILSEVPEVTANVNITGIGAGNRSIMFARLSDWEDRERKTQEIVADVRARYSQEITGGMALAIPVRPLGQRGTGEGVQFVLRGTDFDRLQELSTSFMNEMRDSGLFSQPRAEPSPNKPQLDVRIDRARAADLGVPISEIASTLETLLGGRRVTEFRRGDKRYNVLLQIEDAGRTTPADLTRVFARSADGTLVQLSSLVTSTERAVPENYPRFDRLRAVNISAQMTSGRALGEGLQFIEGAARRILPDAYSYALDGETREYVESSGDTFFLFGLALLFAFLILAAQFESLAHPITIFTGVALAISGGIIVLYATRWWGPGMTDNLFSRFGLIMLIGLVAKNGILIVEFANQLQMQGRKAADAAFEAATLRFRPILMTAISTVFGALPIAFATGAGAETRNPLGIVVVGGLGIATILTLFIIPIVYVMVDRIHVKLTGRPSAYGLLRAREIQIESERAEEVAVAR